MALGLAACGGGGGGVVDENDDETGGNGVSSYAVTPTAGANGSISPDIAQAVNHGATTSFAITPNTGYSIDTVGGTCGGSLVGNTYTTGAITADCTVTASFNLNSYTVTPSAGANGSISPDIAQAVNHGATTSFAITPNTGYSIATVDGCGGSLAGNTYTTGAITADCTVTASFSLNSYTVTPSAGANGSISPNTAQTVNHGESTTFTITPNDLYRIDTVGGTCGGTLDGSTYTTGVITSDCSVAASFGGPTLSLTPTAIKTFRFSWADVSGETEYRLLENPDGSSGYTQVATIAADATSHDLVVSLPARINARYMLRACNDGGCSDSNEVFVSGTLAEAVGYVKASNTNAEDQFGISVALAADGNTLAVGAPYEDSNATGSCAPDDIDCDTAQADNSAGFSGAVYVFTRSGTIWSQQAYVKASNTEAIDWFGTSLALAADGNTLAVGAYGEDSNATGINGAQGDNNATNSGAVYVFTRSDTTWSQQAYVKASNTQAYDSFGRSLALAADGNTLAVGAISEGSNATGSCAPDDIDCDTAQADNSANGSGAVYVFTRSDSAWSQQAYVKASNTEAFDYFGTSVALAADGNTLAVGALRENSNATDINGNQTNNSATDSGAVYVFTRSDSAWSQQAYVKASNTGASDYFGTSVALAADGNTLAVGARLEDSNATDIDGNQTDNSTSNSGAVYVFTRSGSAWSQQAYIKASNTGANDQFGWSFALAADGNTLAVGAPYEDSNATGIDGNQTDNGALSSGAVYVFTRSDTTWSQQAYVKASSTEAFDRFGASVALAADGNTLAVGASGEDSNATGIDGAQDNNNAADSGAVYLY